MKHKDFNISPAPGGYSDKTRRSVPISTTFIWNRGTYGEKMVSSLNLCHCAFQDYILTHVAAEQQLMKYFYPEYQWKPLARVKIQ